MKFQNVGLKGVVIKGEAVIELDKVKGVEIEVRPQGSRYKSFVLSAPGDMITLTLSNQIERTVEEFVDLVVDGILRATSPIRKGNGGKRHYKASFDKVLFYRFEGDKKKSLKSGAMKVHALSSATSIAGVKNPLTTTIGTIELQYWKKYPADAIPDELAATMAANLDRDKRVSNWDEIARWSDKRQSLTPGVPQDFEISFIDERTPSKTMKDRFAEERTGFGLFTSVMFHLASKESIDRLDFDDASDNLLSPTPRLVNHESVSTAPPGPSGSEHVAKISSEARESISREKDRVEKSAKPKKKANEKISKPVKEKTKQYDKPQKFDMPPDRNEKSVPKIGTQVGGLIHEDDPNWPGHIAFNEETRVTFIDAPQLTDKRNNTGRKFPAVGDGLVDVQADSERASQNFHAINKDPKKTSICGVKGGPADMADKMHIRRVSPVTGQTMITAALYAEPSVANTNIRASTPEIFVVESPQLPNEPSTPKPIEPPGTRMNDHTTKFTRDIDPRSIDMGELYRASGSANDPDAAGGFRSTTAIAASSTSAPLDVPFTQSFHTSLASREAMELNEDYPKFISPYILSPYIHSPFKGDLAPRKEAVIVLSDGSVQEEEGPAMGVNQVEPAKEVSPVEVGPTFLPDREDVDRQVGQLGSPTPENLRSMAPSPPTPISTTAELGSVLRLDEFINYSSPSSDSTSSRLISNSFRSAPAPLGLGLSFGGDNVMQSIEVRVPIKSSEITSPPFLSEAAHLRQTQSPRQVSGESLTSSCHAPASPGPVTQVLAPPVNAFPATTSLAHAPVTPTKSALITPANTAEKRKAFLISRDTAEPTSTFESDNSKPPKISRIYDTYEVEQMMIIASRRIAAAQEKRERIMADESTALKLKRLEDEADRLEQENAEREANIDTIYHTTAVKYENMEV